MNFTGALIALKRGHKVKRHHWSGHWIYDAEKDTIIMITHDSKRLDFRETEDLFYTLSNTVCDDWEIIEDWK